MAEAKLVVLCLQGICIVDKVIFHILGVKMRR